MSKSELISLRLKPEDISFLSGLDSSFGTTTSEKIRSIIRMKKEDLKSDQNLNPVISNVIELLSSNKKQLQAQLIKNAQRSEIFDLLWDFPVELLTKLSSDFESVDIEKLEYSLIEDLNFILEKYISIGLGLSPRVINNRYFLDSLNSLMSLLKSVEQKSQTKGK